MTKRYRNRRRLEALSLDEVMALSRVVPWLKDIEENRGAQQVPQWTDAPAGVRRDAATARRAIERIFAADRHIRDHPYEY